MKKLILSFGSIMILFLLVFSCTEERESIQLPEESVNLKVATNAKKQEEDKKEAYDVAQLLTYLHGYIKAEVSEDYKYYENMPERKEADWFYENFKKHLRSGSDTDNWVLDKIDSGEIFIFGTTVKDVKVAALIFSDGLVLPEQFIDSSGFFFDTDREDCDIFVRYGFLPGDGCSCHWVQSCHRGGCLKCPNKGADLNLENLFDLDQWIIENYDFEKGLRPFFSIPILKYIS